MAWQRSRVGKRFGHKIASSEGFVRFRCRLCDRMTQCDIRSAVWSGNGRNERTQAEETGPQMRSSRVVAQAPVRATQCPAPLRTRTDTRLRDRHEEKRAREMVGKALRSERVVANRRPQAPSAALPSDGLVSLLVFRLGPSLIPCCVDLWRVVIWSKWLRKAT